MTITCCSISTQSADAKLGGDLLSFGVKILVLGDPYQLPPVRGTGFFSSTKPDSILSEIFRQKKGTAVLDMATRVCQCGADSLPFDGKYHLRFREVGSSELLAMAAAADQVVVGLHDMRPASC